MTDKSPLWCANDEPHPAHRERNDFNGWNDCTGRSEMTDKTEAEKLAAIIAGSVYGMQSGEWDGPKEPNAGDMQIAYDILANYRLSPQVEGTVEWGVAEKEHTDHRPFLRDVTEEYARKEAAIIESWERVSRTVTEWKPEGD